jgi:hypothetical protein
MLNCKRWMTLALIAVAPALAEAQTAGGLIAGSPAKDYRGDDLPQVYWQISATYGTEKEVTATAPYWQPDPPHEIAVASLNLPPGNYLVSAKLSEWNPGDAAWGDLECVLGNPADPGHADYSSVGLGGAEKVLTLQIPVTATGRRTTIAFACHIYGVKTDGTTPATAFIWGAKIYAVRVGSIVQQ